MNPSVAEDHGEQDQLLGGPNGAPHTTTTTNGHRPGLYKRFKQAAKKLKHEVLALYYALQASTCPRKSAATTACNVTNLAKL